MGMAIGWTIAIAQQPQSAAEARSDSAKADSPLATLDWLVGEWTNEGEKVAIEFNCHFSKNDAFLIRSFRNTSDADSELSGMQVIAWDPSKSSIRSWTFDSNGGFGEDAWSQSGNRYTLRASYTLPDGSKGAAVNVLTYIDDNHCTWKSVGREIDGELLPDSEEVTIVRKAQDETSKK
jgi:hypothetical protein